MGVPHLNRSGRGDQLVMTNVVIPTKLSDKQQKLFSELAGTLGKEVIPQREKGLLNYLKEALGDALGI
jgi:molecular chaperone DnaJ